VILGVTLIDGVLDGVILGVMDGVTLILGVLDGVILIDGVILGVLDGEDAGDILIDGVIDGVTLGVLDGVTLGVILILGVMDGVTDGVGEGGTQLPPTAITAPLALIWNEYASPTPFSFNAIQFPPPLVGEEGYES
jgi:hypothetical protein